MNETATHPPASGDGNLNAPPRQSLKRENLLLLAALGIVYGDIGTSPLYAVRQSVLAAGGETPNEIAVLGSLSLIFWSLVIVVTIKYVSLVLRADNRGEGGVLAITSLAHRAPGLSRRMKSIIAFVAVLGLALFFGDGLLTPAISVLAAVEGLKVEEPSLAPLVLPTTVAILVGLFLLQSHGTARVGRLFGPIVLVWFLTLGTFGLNSIATTPAILAAVNPYEAARMFLAEPWIAFVSLGAVVLAVTGCEALYADMGHFGRGPIKDAWVSLVLPCLLLNYFGQGAAILRDPAALDHPFYAVAPAGMHYPLLVLATLATIIASQAVISGVFSLTRQAVLLGKLPRMRIRHTSATDWGQIYVPRANTVMLVGVITIVMIFQSSDALGTAYGVTVTGLMMIDTCLISIVAAKIWGWGRWAILLFAGLFFIDAAFLSANALKIVEGGWLPVAVAITALIFMGAWREGRKIFVERAHGSGLSLENFLPRADKTPLRVAGTAIYMAGRLDQVPHALLHNLKHNQVLHERVIILHVMVEDIPFVPPERRIHVQKLGKGFYTMELHFGFFEESDVPRALEAARAFGLAIDLDHTTFFVGRETIVRSAKPTMSRWRTKLFMTMAAAAEPPAQFYRLPPGRVVELGAQIEM
ncbi:MAG: potassium transporter Kup [Alphaproteobacteria bacterium]